MTRERSVWWDIESMRYHGPNMVSCELINRLTRTPLVGAYLPLSTLDHLPDLEEYLKRFKYPIVLGYLNMDLGETRSPRSHQVADLLAE